MFKIKSEYKYKSAVLIAVCIVAAFAAAFSNKLGKSIAAQSPQNLAGENNAQRLDFLRSYGVETEEEPVSVSDVIIPVSFDGMYQNFETVQNAQGLSLSEYKGEKVRRYSYLVINPPNGFGTTYAELFVHNGKIIACALCDMQNKCGFSKIIC